MHYNFHKFKHLPFSNTIYNIILESLKNFFMGTSISVILRNLKNSCSIIFLLLIFKSSTNPIEIFAVDARLTVKYPLQKAESITHNDSLVSVVIRKIKIS